MVDLDRSLRMAMSTGKVRIGLAETRRALSDRSAKLVVVADNCPDEQLRLGEMPVRRIVYPGDNTALGAACGKPFAISALVVVDEGGSNILSA